MPVQKYTINTRDEVAGQLYGMQQSRAQIESKKVAGAPLDVGIAVKQAVFGEVQAGVVDQASKTIYGISLKQQGIESDFRPNTGAALYPLGHIAPILRDGYVNVIAVDAVTFGTAPYVDTTTGKFYGAAGAGRIKATNCMWDVTVGAGAVGRVVLTLGQQTIAVV